MTNELITNLILKHYKHNSKIESNVHSVYVMNNMNYYILEILDYEEYLVINTTTYDTSSHEDMLDVYEYLLSPYYVEELA